MGLFVIPPKSDSERRAEEREIEKECSEIAAETLKLVENAPDEAFPSFLWEPQINEFESGQDYKTRATCTDPNVLRAYSLGRKYSNYWEYLEALEIYEDYAAYVEKVFGSFEMMKRAAKEGYSSVFIPPEPKLTHKKRNKILIESGFLPSIGNPDYEPVEGAIDESVEHISEGELTEEDIKFPKYVRRVYDEMFDRKGRADRIANMYRHGGAVQGMDAIVQFLTSSSTDNAVTNPDAEPLLTDIIESLHEFDGMSSEMIESLLTPKQQAIIDSGMFINKRDKDTIDLIRTLEMNGFNFLGSTVTQGMSTDAVRALNREFAHNIDVSEMTKKQRKKYEKKMKKEREDRRLQMAGDRRIQDTLLKSRIRLNITGDDSLNNLTDFRLSDVFGPEDD